MRIAVVEFAGRGGMIHYAYQLCDALAAEGADVTLLTDRHYELASLAHTFRAEPLLRLWDPKPPGPIALSAMARTARRLRRGVRALRYYREWIRLIARLWRDRPDIVQFGDIRFGSDVAGLAVLRLLGLRLADICHNVRPFSARHGSRRFVRESSVTSFLFTRVYWQFELVFTHFDTNRRAFLEAFALDANRVTAIAHGDEGLFERVRDPMITPNSLRQSLGIAPDEPVVLAFGTLASYKGPDLLLRAFPRVLARHGSARLVFAGFPAPGFDLDGCRGLAGALSIEQAVRFVPRYIESREVAAWMELAAVAVFPYRMVYHSGALHIAHTFGVPAVATRVGTMGDVIVDGESGILVAPDDAGALADAVSMLLDDRDLARRLGRRAAEDARRRFAWERVARTMLGRYAQLFGEAS